MMRSSSPSTPLFEQPFLHRRENDSFSYSTTNSNQQQPQYVSSFPKRRRGSSRRNVDQLVQTAMRAVLLSPVIVLVIWSVVAIMFTSKQQRSNVVGVSNGNRSRHNRQFPRAPEGLLDVVEVVETAMGESQPKNRIPIVQPLGATAQQQAMTSTSSSGVIVAPRPHPKQRVTASGVNSSPVYMATESQGQQMMSVQTQQMVGVSQQQSQGQLSATNTQTKHFYRESQPIQMMSQGTQPMMEGSQPAVQMTSNSQPAVTESQPQMQLSASSTSAAAAPVQLASQPAQTMSMKGQNQLSASGPSTVYYYYDPRELMQRQDGQMVLPDRVYDQYGNPHHLSQIRAKEMYLEPPVAQAPRMGAASPSTTTSAARQESQPQMGDSSSGSSTQWGESRATDQSIIVCTVGLMALLVGAVSARRARTKSILSACIENESLVEEEAAYDAAYTVTSDSYRTFGSTSVNNEGWKGDLEKFDV